MAHPNTLLALLFVALSGCSRSTESEASNPNRLRADQDVVMDQNSYGCESPSRFSKALEHRQKGEMHARSSIVTDKPACFYGAGLNAGQTWTVMQIRGDTMLIAQTTLS